MKNKGCFFVWLGKDMMKMKDIFMKGEGVNRRGNGLNDKISKEQLQSIRIWSYKRI